VSEFIKRGEDAAEVEVTLCTDTPGRPLVVWRKIKKDNSSDWKLNGACASPRPPHARPSTATQKSANRNGRVWHGATENGP
jgi:hypothetical protein